MGILASIFTWWNGATLGTSTGAAFTLVSDDVGVAMPVEGSSAGTVQVTGTGLNDVVRVQAGAKKNTIDQASVCCTTVSRPATNRAAVTSSSTPDAA